MVRRLAVLLLALVVAGGAAAAWMYRSGRLTPVLNGSLRINPAGKWLDKLQSTNPRVAEEGDAEVMRLGAGALPQLREALKDPNATPERTKAALRACSLLGVTAAPLLPEVAAHLTRTEFASEAGVALSVMGPDAFTPLANALTSHDPAVRKEALRGLGKLQQRAPLDPDAVIPPLLDALADRDPGVRMIATTYLGIIHQNAETVVPAVAEMLKDEDPEVRTAAARALGSFGAGAAPALPALRRAAGDRDENVAREAGLALVKLHPR